MITIMATAITIMAVITLIRIHINHGATLAIMRLIHM